MSKSLDWVCAICEPTYSAQRGNIQKAERDYTNNVSAFRTSIFEFDISYLLITRIK